MYVEMHNYSRRRDADREGQQVREREQERGLGRDGRRADAEGK